MPRNSFDEMIGRLRPRLSTDLPGLPSQLRMAPSQRASMLVDASADNARPAAVLVVLENAQEPGVILTERRRDLASHPGQISFPGGRQEPNETLETTALREAHEEIGLQATDVEVIGELTSLFVPPSNYMVHPFVAWSPARIDLTPSDDEVNAIIRASLQDLLDHQNRRTETWSRNGTDVSIPLFELGGHKVWGATAMILAELVDALQLD